MHLLEQVFSALRTRLCWAMAGIVIATHPVMLVQTASANVDSPTRSSQEKVEEDLDSIWNKATYEKKFTVLAAIL